MFDYQIDQHVPLAAIGGGIEQQKRDETAVDLLATLRRLHNIVQKVIAALDFVPIEEKCLREFELVQIVVLHEGQAYTIESRKQPAASGAALIGNRFAFGFHLVVEHMIGRFQCLAREAHIEWIHTRANVLGQKIFRFTVEILTPFF